MKLDKDVIKRVSLIILCLLLLTLYPFSIVYSETSDNPISEKETIAQNEPVQSQESTTEDKPSFDIGPEEPMFASTINAFNISDIQKIASMNNVLSSFQTDLYTGKASMQVPINLPKGRLGIQPNLSIIYQSSGPNTWCGKGWMFEIGYISRSLEKGVPKYDSTDTFVFNFNGSSQELVSIGNDEYRIKLESNFMKFKYNSPYWMVTDRSGTKYFFGQEIKARQEKDNDDIFSWYLTEIIDRKGNYIKIKYYDKDSTNQIYPEEIQYTGIKDTSVPSYKINFVLEDRDDNYINCLSGIRIETQKRLSNILIYFDQNLLFKYELSYYSCNSKRTVSLLKSVKFIGFDSDNSNFLSLPPITFKYYETKFQFSEAYTWETVDISRYNSTFFASDGYVYLDLFDMNGDGLPDRVYRGETPAIWYIQKNNGQGFDAREAWTGIIHEEYDGAISYIPQTRPVVTMDINRDGLPDRIIAQQSNEWQVCSNSGNSFADNETWGTIDSSRYESTFFESNSYVYLDMLDMNGDGLPDRVYRGDTPAIWYVQKNNGQGFNTREAWTGIINEEYDGAISFVADYKYITTMDINGDGLPDRIIAKNPNEWKVCLNIGNSFADNESWGPIDSTRYESTFFSADAYVYLDMFDVNGDGLPDRVYRGDTPDFWYVQTNNGHGFNQPEQWTGISNEEYNGGISFTPEYRHVLTKDINGDGLPDRIIAKVQEDWIVCYNDNTLPPNILTEISNGIGGKTSVSYKPYKGADNTEPTKKSKLPFPVWVVDTVTSSDSVSGDSNTITYNYDSGIFDFDEREFRGFGYVKVIDNDGSYNETWFHQDDIYKGKIYKQQVSDNDGNVYTKTETTWQSESLYDDKVKFPYQAQVDSYSYQ